MNPEGATYSLKFAQSFAKSSRTSKLLPPCRSLKHGRQLRNNSLLTLIDMQLLYSNFISCGVNQQQNPIILVFLRSIFLSASLLRSEVLFLCCPLLCLYFYFGPTYILLLSYIHCKLVDLQAVSLRKENHIIILWHYLGN